MYLGFSFEKGGNLFVELCDKTPHTLRTLSKILPLESEARHTRWCGREVYFPICTRQTPCRENQTSTVSKFDVAYWTEWDIHANPPDSLTEETLSFYYGAEVLRFHGGPLKVNVIGRISWDQESLLEEIGERVWHCGFEKIKISLIAK